MPDSPEAVLAFWFGDAPDDATVIAERNARWWGGDAALDAEIAERFGARRTAAIRGALDAWLATPRGRLALILLVDQFSRNLFRGRPEAFAHDPLARRWCEDGLACAADRALRPIERVFFYLPLEHAESRTAQARSVLQFEALQAAVPAGLREAFGSYADYARRHYAVIERFGRFPHRNAVLGRPGTAQEIAFLAEPGSSF